MLRVRLFRVGRKNNPAFKIVVTNKSNPPRGGRFVEVVGSYNPQLKKIELKKERIKHWLSVGVQPSGTVHNLLVDQGIIKGSKVKVWRPKKKKGKKEEVPPAKEEKSPETGAETQKPEEPIIAPKVEETPRVKTEAEKPEETKRAPEGKEEASTKQTETKSS